MTLLYETRLTKSFTENVKEYEPLSSALVDANCTWATTTRDEVFPSSLLADADDQLILQVAQIKLICNTLPTTATVQWNVNPWSFSALVSAPNFRSCTANFAPIPHVQHLSRVSSELCKSFESAWENTWNLDEVSNASIGEINHGTLPAIVAAMGLALVAFGMVAKRKKQHGSFRADSNYRDNQSYAAESTINGSNNGSAEPLLANSSEDMEHQGNHGSESAPFNHFLSSAFDSIAGSKVVPQAAKAAFPILIVGAICLFLSSNLSIGAAVSLNLKLGNFQMEPFQLFAFSLGNTIHDMLQAKVYALALLVLVWSGIWPYLKLVLMFVCWTFPCSRRGERVRGRVLHVLDALGKWCMIDIFLLLMMTVAFRFHVTSSTIPTWGKYLPDDFVLVDVEVLPDYGIFGFVTATIVSLVTNHMAVAYHRNTYNYKFVDVSDHLAPHALQAVSTDESSHHPRVVFHRRRRSSQLSQGAAEELRELAGVRADQSLQARLTVQNSIASLNIRSRSGSMSSVSTVITIVDDETARRRFCCPCPKFSWFDKGSVERQGRIGTDGIAALPPDLSENLGLNERIVLEAVTYKEALFVHYYNGEETNTVPLIRNVVVSSLLVLCVILVLWGAITDSFEFVFKGLAGQLIDVVSPGSGTRSFSMITIATALSDDGTNAGIVFLQSVYLGFAFVFPLIQIIFLTVIWFAPMTLRDLKIVLYTSEVVSAWASIDVFIISLIASVVEIDQFARFLIGDRCDPIEAIVQEQCFGVETTLLSGCWLVFSAAVVLIIATQVIFSFAQKAISERESRSIASVAG